ncbi:MAG TPA: Ig-like domain-containing protein, partial [Thermoanaerobaculia bacterium]
MRAVVRVGSALAVLALSGSAAPGFAAPTGEATYRLAIGGDRPLFSALPQVTIAGTTDAPPGSRVEVAIGEARHAAAVAEGGAWSLAWPQQLAAGTYTVRATVRDPAGAGGGATQVLIVQLPGRLPRRPLVAPPSAPPAPRERPADDFQELTDRWRIVPPPYELNVRGSRWDPYNQNRWKGDYPIRGNDLFLNLTAVSDTLLEGRNVPTPSGVSADRPGSIEFFGEEGQLLANQVLLFSADLFKGDTAFRPIDWRVKGTLVFNLNHVRVGENAVVKPDVRDGTERTRGFLALQELFGEMKLRDLSPNFDFVSIRAGVQPFASDFRGFVFTDTNLGVRLFGNLHANRDQWNVAFFERLEKDTNSGLNSFAWRDQRVAVANVYRQDFLVKGYTAELSLHYLRDDPSFEFDKNGFLARPDPLGAFTPHAIEAVYLGWASFGHVGRLNIDHAVYYVLGDDSLNPLAGRAVDIAAGMAALELSIDRDWLRPRLAVFYASGDRDPGDGDARGFDAIFDNPAFAGGGFSFWNRLGIRLAGTGVALVNRGSLLPDLTSGKDEGQPNFVNPGLLLLSAGLDAELTPRLKAVATANYLRFDRTEPLELALFQAAVGKEIGWDLSLGARWRPFLNNNAAVLAGIAGLLPGDGFADIYERAGALVTA